MSFHVGVTARRTPLSPAQRAWLARLAPLWNANVFLHQGCCVGGDTEVSIAAHVNGARIVSHPPDNPRLRYTDAEYTAETVCPEKPYLDRNTDIIAASSLVIAFPDGPYRLRSGTWSTIRKAVIARRPCLVCLPDGTVHDAVDLLP